MIIEGDQIQEKKSVIIFGHADNSMTSFGHTWNYVKRFTSCWGNLVSNDFRSGRDRDRELTNEDRLMSDFYGAPFDHLKFQ